MQIKQLADCFLTENIFDNLEGEHANSEDDVKFDDLGNVTNLDIPAQHKDITEYRNNTEILSTTVDEILFLDLAEDVTEYKNTTKSISSTIGELLSLNLPAYSPDMDEPDSGNQLHKCGECGAGYRWKSHLVQHIRSKHEGIKYSCNQCEYQATRQ